MHLRNSVAKLIAKNCMLALLTLSLLTLTACKRENENASKISTDQREAVSQLPKLLDLGAHKCIPCKKMAPILDELTSEYKGVFDVEFIDVWQPENKERANSYRIESIPTQIFFDADGKELWRHVGFISKADILKKWEELGFSFNPGQPQKPASSTGAATNSAEK